MNAEVLIHRPDSSLDAKREALLSDLRAVVGRRYLLTSTTSTAPFRTGYRTGSGSCLAVIQPGSLVETWRVLQRCVEADVIIIMQAANTGLTGGSTPDVDDYDRDVVVINTLRMNTVRSIRGGEQVVCLPGATLNQLEKLLAPMGREPHSVIGSSCIGASVFGGVCNNSGGSLVHRGPAYTELSVYASVDETGELVLINHLDIQLGHSPEEILGRLDRGDYTDTDIELSGGRRGSDDGYASYVRKVDEPTPARYNADPSRLHEASGSAGKVAVFALRLDTFPAPKDPAVFYIGTNDTKELTSLRRRLLTELAELPIAGEYMHREAYDIAERYGKDTFLAIRWLGTSRIPALMALKSRVDLVASRLRILPTHFADRLLQAISHLASGHLPRRMTEFRDRYEHHLMLKVAAAEIDSVRILLQSIFPSEGGDFFECTADEGARAFLHRFAAAGAAVRYRAVHARDVEDIVALDVALPRSAQHWFEQLPEHISSSITHALYYGHFLCYVFHQDYIVKKGVSPMKLEHEMLVLLDDRGAEYPAEHNVGHLYEAKESLIRFYKKLDPGNRFNPGIGLTSKRREWA